MYCTRNFVLLAFKYEISEVRCNISEDTIMKRHGISLRVLNGFVVGLFLFMSCATTTISLQPDPSCQQQVLYDSGKKMFVSTQRNVVAVRLNTEYLYAGERGEISVCVLNSGKDLFDFGPENIHVRSATDELKVYTYEELVAELEQAWRSQAMAMALVGTLNAVNAQQSAYQYNYGSFNAPLCQHSLRQPPMRN